MSHHLRLIELVAGWIDEALTTLDEFDLIHEYIRWDVTFQAYPDSSAETETWIPQLVMYFEIDGPVEGTSVFGVPLVRPYSMTQEFVQELAVSAVRDCLAKRTAERHRLQDDTDHAD